MSLVKILGLCRAGELRLGGAESGAVRSAGFLGLSE